MNFDLASFIFGFLSCMAVGLVITYSILQFQGKKDDRPFHPKPPKK